MKKIVSFVFSLALVLPVAASAASFVVTPSTGSYTVGDTIIVNVSVNPAGSAIYTAMLDARFSPTTLEVASFTLNDSLLPLKQSGYDALNNASGVLTKTGGYTGGISATGAFGIVVLRAKAAGTGTFTVADSSKLLDSNNTDQQSGEQTNSYTIVTKPEPQVVVAPQTTVQATSEQKAPAAKPAASKNTAVIASATGSSATSTQVAAAATFGMGSLLAWILGILALLATFAGGFFAGRYRVR